MTKRREFWLLQNVFYNHRRIVRKRWWHSIFGTPGMFVIAKIHINGDEDEAASEFTEAGFYV